MSEEKVVLSGKEGSSAAVALAGRKPLSLQGVARNFMNARVFTSEETNWQAKQLATLKRDLPILWGRLAQGDEETNLRATVRDRDSTPIEYQLYKAVYEMDLIGLGKLQVAELPRYKSQCKALAKLLIQYPCAGKTAEKILRRLLELAYLPLNNNELTCLRSNQMSFEDFESVDTDMYAPDGTLKAKEAAAGEVVAAEDMKDDRAQDAKSFLEYAEKHCPLAVAMNHMDTNDSANYNFAGYFTAITAEAGIRYRHKKDLLHGALLLLAAQKENRAAFKALLKDKLYKKTGAAEFKNKEEIQSAIDNKKRELSEAQSVAEETLLQIQLEGDGRDGWQGKVENHGEQEKKVQRLQAELEALERQTENFQSEISKKRAGAMHLTDLFLNPVKVEMNNWFLLRLTGKSDDEAKKLERQKYLRGIEELQKTLEELVYRNITFQDDEYEQTENLMKIAAFAAAFKKMFSSFGNNKISFQQKMDACNTALLAANQLPGATREEKCRIFKSVVMLVLPLLILTAVFLFEPNVAAFCATNMGMQDMYDHLGAFISSALSAISALGMGYAAYLDKKDLRAHTAVQVTRKTFQFFQEGKSGDTPKVSWRERMSNLFSDGAEAAGAALLPAAHRQ
jgi:hypothetical protein